MRRRDDGWDDGRRDRGDDGGWPDGSYGSYGDRGDGRGSGQGYGRPDYQAYPGPGRQESAAAGWDQPARDGASPGYADRVNGGHVNGGHVNGGHVNGDMTRVDAGFGDSAPNGRGYSGDGSRQQANFTPSFTPSAAPSEFSPSEAPAPERSGGRRPYGRLSIFTLLDDKTAEFDRLAEEAAEGVRASEPDTLVYVIHVVPKAPMQRIIYEIYRDRAAFENHESQPHIARFTEARKSCVLATNIIDLRLKYAKVAALFQGDQQAGRRMDADDDYGVLAGGGAGSRPPQPTLRALEAGPGPVGGDDYLGGQPAAGQYAGAQPGAAQYGPAEYAVAEYGPAEYGSPQYGSPQYGGAQYADARYGAQYGADQYAGGQSGQAQPGNGQHGGAYGQNGQNGAYGQNGQYNGAGQYQGYGENGGYRGAAGPGPGAGRDDAQPPGRPPWEDSPDWAPSPYSGERYRD